MVEITNNDELDFYRKLSSFGYADLNTALEKFRSVGLFGDDLANQVQEFSENSETNITDIDICAVAFDHILQIAKNKIEEVLNFDMENDVEFYVYSNYMCTEIIYEPEDQQKLQKVIDNATQKQKQELVNNNFVIEFLNDVNIEIIT